MKLRTVWLIWIWRVPGGYWSLLSTVQAQREDADAIAEAREHAEARARSLATALVNYREPGRWAVRSARLSVPDDPAGRPELPTIPDLQQGSDNGD